ncbi:2-oxoacid:acceptor oxidoreductase subunit alpha [Candidatus Bipolaricaulota bacterium]|nr:2-oxoacid:acceptor oxidoreductase subunit alpha [Candidatus Bipolaricaulota bacterium]
MKKNDMTVLIGGDAGQGIQSTGNGFIQSLTRAGLFPFGRQDYRSRIRGGHNFFEIRVSDEQIYTHSDGVDLLVALTEDSVEKHLEEIFPGGGVLYDEDFDLGSGVFDDRDVRPFPVPFTSIATDEGGAKVMANTAAVGAVAGLTGFDTSFINEIIKENFAVKGDSIVENNVQVAEAGREYVESKGYEFDYELTPIPGEKDRMVIDGNQAFALGAVTGGCNFISAYPMTPSTSILEWLTKHSAELDIVIKQPESELAAINMAIGAGHAGARSLVTTSGGGFSLMVESLGLAGMTETPIVIAEVQRPGPSTGLPTRTEQGDLASVVFASQGDSPRLVLAPATIEEAFRAGKRAFDLAEKYQLPVVVLSDQHLADSIRAIPPEEFDTSVEIDRGELLSEEELEKLEGDYLRHEFTESGVSPRAIPGNKNAVYKTTGNEHDERGDITEDPDLRTRMMDKRMKKVDTALEKEFSGPLLYGPENADLTFVSWGSTYGAVRESVDRLNEDGTKTNFYHIDEIWPLKAGKIKDILESSRRTLLVENNYSGQLASLITRETGALTPDRILKYDGRPFTPERILAEVQDLEEVE